MSLPCGCPSARCLVATLVLPCGLWAQPAVPGPVLQLPTYTVTGERELPPPERWFYARIPGFEVLSNA